MNPRSDTLLMIPTYNEAENIAPIYEALVAARSAGGGDFDLLFVDDNSPDGTGQIADRLAAADTARVFVLHRPRKMGVGAAHQDGIAWAYAHGYRRLVTMDCDFTHDPARVAEFLAASEAADIVIGSRFEDPENLQSWVWYRRLLTHLAHRIIVLLLGMGYDASGAFRVYRLDRIPASIFALVRDPGYSFFWESLYILWLNGFAIHEIAIPLPARTYGHSKMRWTDVATGMAQLGAMFWRSVTDRASLRLEPGSPGVQPAAAHRANSAAEWDDYWTGGKAKSPGWYDAIARFYRYRIIQPALDRFVAATFAPGSRLLHAGCGSGEVDAGVVAYARVTALDISDAGLARYRSHHAGSAVTLKGSILDIPAPAASFDGVYSLGVLEHFSAADIRQALGEFARVLKPGGKILLFWPPDYGLSVIVLRLIHFFLNRVQGRNIRLHPDEPSLIRSRNEAEAYLGAGGFRLVEYAFGPRDAFTYAVVVGVKTEDKKPLALAAE